RAPHGRLAHRPGSIEHHEHVERGELRGALVHHALGRTAADRLLLHGPIDERCLEPGTGATGHTEPHGEPPRSNHRPAHRGGGYPLPPLLDSRSRLRAPSPPSRPISLPPPISARPPPADGAGFIPMPFTERPCEAPYRPPDV